MAVTKQQAIKELADRMKRSGFKPATIKNRLNQINKLKGIQLEAYLERYEAGRKRAAAGEAETAKKAATFPHKAFGKDFKTILPSLIEHARKNKLKIANYPLYKAASKAQQDDIKRGVLGFMHGEHKRKGGVETHPNMTTALSHPLEAAQNLMGAEVNMGKLYAPGDYAFGKPSVDSDRIKNVRDHQTKTQDANRTQQPAPATTTPVDPVATTTNYPPDYHQPMRPYAAMPFSQRLADYLGIPWVDPLSGNIREPYRDYEAPPLEMMQQNPQGYNNFYGGQGQQGQPGFDPYQDLTNSLQQLRQPTPVPQRAAPPLTTPPLAAAVPNDGTRSPQWSAMQTPLAGPSSAGSSFSGPSSMSSSASSMSGSQPSTPTGLAAPIPYSPAAATTQAPVGTGLSPRAEDKIANARFPRARAVWEQFKSGIPSAVAGDPASLMTMQRLQPDQAAGQQMLLGGGLAGLTQRPLGAANDYASFEQQARRDFRTRTLPHIANQYGGMGMLQSSGYRNALAGAGADLEAQLAQQRGQYNLQRQPQEDAFMMGLVDRGMQPRTEQLYSPAQPGVMQGMAQGAGNYMTSARK